jgi:hypothetical protein
MTDTAATLKYIHVGQARVSFAQAVRETVVPLGWVTVRKVDFVELNFMRVRVMGIRTAMETRKARIREIRRRRRM